MCTHVRGLNCRAMVRNNLVSQSTHGLATSIERSGSELRNRVSLRPWKLAVIDEQASNERVLQCAGISLLGFGFVYEQS